MLSNTEQKLSALKAINEEKETIDNLLEALEAPIGTLTISYPKETNQFIVSGPPADKVNGILKEHYTRRRAELISKANEIMKSE